MRSPPTPPTLTTLILLTALSTLSLNMFLPSLANIAEDFGADYALASVSIGGYLAFTAVLQLVVGPLSDRIGRRPVVLGATAVFCVASIGCALAPNVWIFLTCRMLQGAMITGYALSLAIVRDTRDTREAVSLIGYIGMAMALAPMLGPMLGGALDTAFGWRSTFYAYSGAGLALLLLCWRDLGETRPPKPATRSEFGSALRILSQSALFRAFVLCNTLSTGAFYVFLTGAPLVAQAQFGLTTAELGIYMGTITGGFMLGGYVAGRLGAHVAPTALMIAGRVIACAGPILGIASVLSQGLSPMLFFASTMLVGLGNGITLPGCNAGAMSVRPDLAGSAAGLSGAAVVAGGAVLTTMTATILPEAAPALPLLGVILSVCLAGLVVALRAHQLSEPARA